MLMEDVLIWQTPSQIVSINLLAIVSSDRPILLATGTFPSTSCKTSDDSSHTCHV